MSERSPETLLHAAEPLIEWAVAEDSGPGDATSESTLAAGPMVQGHIRAKSGGVVAGLPVAQTLFQRVDPEIKVVAHAAGGQEVAPGELVGEVTACSHCAGRGSRGAHYRLDAQTDDSGEPVWQSPWKNSGTEPQSYARGR